MDQQYIIDELERRARKAGVSMRAVCLAASVHPTTFSRWKKSEKNPDPIGATLASLGKLDRELSRLERRPVSGKAA